MVAFVAQSVPADAILLPGSACGIPVAPLGLCAVYDQPDSFCHNWLRQENSELPQP